MLPKELPDHHDADLILKLYELRRDPAMREAREKIAKEFWPRTLDDLLAVAALTHPLNAAFRQTSSYWEMVYSMAKYGIIDSDFLMESSGEGMALFAKVHPFLAGYRAQMQPRAFINAEWIATHGTLAKEVFERQQKRVQKALAAR